VTLLTLLTALTAAQDRDPKRDLATGLAAKCGAEIPWAATADEAAARAKKEGKLVLWYVPTVAGTWMDRKPVVDNYMMMGPWMMRDVVALVNRRFSPLKMEARGDLAKACGIARTDFIEPGLVFLTPELKPVHRVDRISTFSEDWILDLLRGVLTANKGYAKPIKGSTADDLALDGDFEGALKAAASPLEKARVYRRWRKPAEAEAALKEAGDGAGLEWARLLLKQGKPAEALDKLAGLKEDEARYLRGVALTQLNRDDEGDAAWREITDEKSPWAWKAAAELARLGPFSRCFEEVAWLPDTPTKELRTSTTHPRKEKELDLVVKRSVALLLRTQRKNGSWNDSNYDFGGRDSLPNVYMAGTALACAALHAWRDADPKGGDAALERAKPYLEDEKNLAHDDDDEIVWAYAYRLLYYARVAAADKAKKEACLPKMNEWVAALAKSQKKSGIWQHEYDAPFTSATVLHALWEAKQAGADVPDETARKGAEALASCRNAKGVYSYGYPARGHPLQQAGGRLPLCEMALQLWGKSTEANVRAAVDTSFELHALLEKARKYDDHAGDVHGIGGFFFWYDMHGRAEAIRRLKGDRAKLLEKQRDLALSITEIDGAFVDSHELGKTYGTAMGLLTLKLAETK
jgi:hypothetical protein